MKELMLSIKPKWCELIASGEKMIEVRKTKPRVEVPFKCYIYCSDGRSHPQYGGKVIGEFVCNEIRDADKLTGAEFFKLSCMSESELEKYAKGHKWKIWCWGITELKMYDKPKELKEFRNLKVKGSEYDNVRMRRPPQSYCFVEKYTDIKKTNNGVGFNYPDVPSSKRWEKMSLADRNAESRKYHLTYGQAQGRAYCGTLPEDFGEDVRG